MQTWFSQPLGDGVMAFGPKEALRAQFERLFEAAGKPIDMAVFTRHELEGRLQCEAVAYFSPAAAALARGPPPTTWICWRAMRGAGRCCLRRSVSRP